MRRPAGVRLAGPYTVTSLSDGSLTVVPTWPDFTAHAGEGAPGLFARMALAHELEAWLNAPYETPEEQA